MFEGGHFDKAGLEMLEGWLDIRERLAKDELQIVCRTLIFTYALSI